MTLNWDVPASKLGVTHHDYRFKTDGSYEDWEEIANSGPGEDNEDSFTVPNLTNDTPYTFQLRAADRDKDSAAAAEVEVTPMAVSTPTPENFAAAPGNARVVLSWDPPAADSGVTRHEYRFKEGTGAYDDDWDADREQRGGRARTRPGPR